MLHRRLFYMNINSHVLFSLPCILMLHTLMYINATLKVLLNGHQFSRTFYCTLIVDVLLPHTLDLMVTSQV